MCPDFRIMQSGSRRQFAQFTWAECRFDRDWAVVQSDFIPAIEPSGGGQEKVGNRIAFQIDYDDGSPRGRAKIREQFHHLIVREMMKEKRAEREIEALGPERKLERIGSYARRRGRGEMRGQIVERSYRDIRIQFANGGAHISGCRADVEQRKRLGWRRERMQQPAQHAVAAEVAIQAYEVGQTWARGFGR